MQAITEDIVCQRCKSTNNASLVESGPHLKAMCNACGCYIKFVCQGKPFVLPFGKYAGCELNSMKSKEEINYLKWLAGVAKGNIVKKITEYLNSISA